MKHIIFFILLFSFDLSKSQTFDKIPLSTVSDVKFFADKNGDYTLLLSYTDFLKTFSKGGFNESDTSYKEYSIMKNLLDDYFSKNNRMQTHQYIDWTSTSFFKVRLSNFKRECIEKGQLLIENDKTKKQETYIYHLTDLKELKQQTTISVSSTITAVDNYTLADKKTVILGLTTSKISKSSK